MRLWLEYALHKIFDTALGFMFAVLLLPLLLLLQLSVLCRDFLQSKPFFFSLPAFRFLGRSDLVFDLHPFLDLSLLQSHSVFMAALVQLL